MYTGVSKDRIYLRVIQYVQPRDLCQFKKEMPGQQRDDQKEPTWFGESSLENPIWIKKVKTILR